MNALHHCFEPGENIEYVSRDIGYSRAVSMHRDKSIKKGVLALLNKNEPADDTGRGTLHDLT
ncbi:hypothetical protein AALB39_20520 [Lachnospiraceae bacterium 54-53]